MAVDLRKIKKLIELVEESGISELEVRDGEEAIRITRPLGGTGRVAAAATPAMVMAPTPAGSAVESGFSVNAPMAGTFYRAPEPGTSAFVEVGQAVQPGELLCIIESMKMMNEITAERAGVVTAVLVPDGQAIESGELLFSLQ